MLGRRWGAGSTVTGVAMEASEAGRDPATSRILVVEDDPQLRAVIVRILALAGLSADAIVHGAAAALPGSPAAALSVAGGRAGEAPSLPSAAGCAPC
jgi:hypothetical protein